LHSAGEALSTVTAKGRPSPEAIATIFVPLPRLVGPTAKPPFWRSRTSHPRMLHLDSTSHVHKGIWLKVAAPQPSCLRQPIAGTGDGRSDTADTWRASRPTAHHGQESRTRRLKPPMCRVRDGCGCPRAAEDARSDPPISTVRLSVPNGRSFQPQRRVEQLQLRRIKPR